MQSRRNRASYITSLHTLCTTVERMRVTSKRLCHCDHEPGHRHIDDIGVIDPTNEAGKCDALDSHA
jgi:hypothetical protein